MDMCSLKCWLTLWQSAAKSMLTTETPSMAGTETEIQCHLCQLRTETHMVKPVLRDHCHKRPPVLTRPHISNRRTYSSIQKKICHQRSKVLITTILCALGHQSYKDRFCCIIQWNLVIKTDHHISQSGLNSEVVLSLKQ